MPADIKRWHSLINNLITDGATTGKPAVRPDDIDDALGLLRTALADRATLLALIAYLRRQVPKGRFRRADPPAEALFARGPDALRDDPAALADLLLDPVALWMLADEIDEQLPAAWRDAQAEVGRAVMAEHGLEMPDFVGLVDEAVGSKFTAVLGTLLDKEGQPAAAPSEMTWTISLTPSEWVWEEGDRSEADGAEATLRVAWLGDGRLTLSLDGFLGPGPGCTLEGEWHPGEGGDPIRGAQPAGADGPLTLTGLPRPPRAGDRLTVTHQYRRLLGGGWKVRVTTTIPREPT